MKLSDLLITALEIFAIGFGLFMAYQLLRKIFGGSWDAENLIIGLVIANITMTFGFAVKNSKDIMRVSSDLKHLTKQFNSLAHDFKSHIRDHWEP